MRSRVTSSPARSPPTSYESSSGLIHRRTSTSTPSSSSRIAANAAGTSRCVESPIATYCHVSTVGVLEAVGLGAPDARVGDDAGGVALPPHAADATDRTAMRTATGDRTTARCAHRMGASLQVTRVRGGTGRSRLRSTWCRRAIPRRWRSRGPGRGQDVLRSRLRTGPKGPSTPGRSGGAAHSAQSEEIGKAESRSPKLSTSLPV